MKKFKIKSHIFAVGGGTTGPEEKTEGEEETNTLQMSALWVRHRRRKPSVPTKPDRGGCDRKANFLVVKSNSSGKKKMRFTSQEQKNGVGASTGRGPERWMENPKNPTLF